MKHEIELQDSEMREYAGRLQIRLREIIENNDPKMFHIYEKMNEIGLDHGQQQIEKMLKDSKDNLRAEFNLLNFVNWSLESIDIWKRKYIEINEEMNELKKLI